MLTLPLQMHLVLILATQPFTQRTISSEKGGARMVPASPRTLGPQSHWGILGDCVIRALELSQLKDEEAGL